MGRWNWQHGDWPNFTRDRQQTQVRLPCAYHKQEYLVGPATSRVKSCPEASALL
ncbi:MAG TPA: hypothetical protein DCY62_08555 [Thalassospira sp.]|nr:hypothetical protein [Thalassospira sp.]